MASNSGRGFACDHNPDKHDLRQHIYFSGNKAVQNLRKSGFCLLLVFLLSVQSNFTATSSLVWVLTFKAGKEIFIKVFLSLLWRCHIKHVKENEPYLMDGFQLIAREPFGFGFSVCFCTSMWAWVCPIFWEFTILQTNKEVLLWRQTQKELWAHRQTLCFSNCSATFWVVVGHGP